MRILKWLLQPAYLLLLIALIALYVNRHTLFPDEVVRSVEAEALVAKIDRLIDRMNSGTNPIVPPATPRPVVVAKGVAQNASAANDTPLSAVPGGEVTVPPTRGVTPPDLALAPQPAEAVSEEVVPGEAKKPAIPQSVTAIDSAQTVELWRAARAAAWQRDLDASVKHYRQLIALQPDNYDAHGEMGNVLLAQYDLAAALDAYAQAARLLYQTGDLMQAHRVVTIVTQLDRQRGQELYNELSVP